MKDLSHVDASGNPTMVDVSDKKVTLRTATAQSVVILGQEIISLLKDKEIHTKKGPVFQTAIIAGVQGAKKTSDLIPFCHPIGLEDCKIDINVEDDRAIIICQTKVTSKTGIEMEALTGASIAALTVYDMCKALSHDIEITGTHLLAKSGGKKDYSK